MKATLNSVVIQKQHWQSKARDLGRPRDRRPERYHLETQISSVMPTEDGGMIVYTSTQNPTEVQKLVAEVIGVPMHKVVIDMRHYGWWLRW